MGNYKSSNQYEAGIDIRIQSNKDGLSDYRVIDSPS